MYYGNFDLLSAREIEELLPEDGVPEGLHFHDIDEELPLVGLSRSDFVDWLTEGRHDCDVARTFGHAWIQEFQGGGGGQMKALKIFSSACWRRLTSARLVVCPGERALSKRGGGGGAKGGGR